MSSAVGKKEGYHVIDAVLKVPRRIPVTTDDSLSRDYREASSGNSHYILERWTGLTVLTAAPKAAIKTPGAIAMPEDLLKGAII